MAKAAKADAATKVPTVPKDFVKQLADMTDPTARESGLMGIVGFYAPKLFPKEKDSGKALKLTREHIESLVLELTEATAHEEILKSVEIDSESIVGALPESVTDILEGDATKRFVITFRWDSAANEGNGAYVMAKSLQTARGPKAQKH